jgi:GNAT superfamily N-acetyltransferase
MNPIIEILHASAIAPADAAEIRRVTHEAFGDEENSHASYAWAPTDWRVMLRVDRQLAATLEIIDRLATVGDQWVHLAGIGGVATRPSWQGRGLGTEMMQRVTSFMREVVNAEFGLLICADRLIPFYARLGWHMVAGPLLFDQPEMGKIVFPGNTLALPLAGKPFPPGPIDLRGLPW